MLYCRSRAHRERGPLLDSFGDCIFRYGRNAVAPAVTCITPDPLLEGYEASKQAVAGLARSELEPHGIARPSQRVGAPWSEKISTTRSPSPIRARPGSGSGEEKGCDFSRARHRSGLRHFASDPTDRKYVCADRIYGFQFFASAMMAARSKSLHAVRNSVEYAALAGSLPLSVPIVLKAASVLFQCDGMNPPNGALVG